MRIKSDQVFLGLAILIYAGLHVPNSWIENSGFAAMFGTLLLVILFWTLIVWGIIRVILLAVYVKGWPLDSWIYMLLGGLLLTATYFGVSLKLSGSRPVALTAYAEGVAGCGETLKLYDDGTFKYHSVCFSMSTTKGSYHWSGDTIHFHEVKLGVNQSLFPEYGWLSEDSSLVKMPFVNDSAEVRLLHMDVTGGV